MKRISSALAKAIVAVLFGTQASVHAQSLTEEEGTRRAAESFRQAQAAFSRRDFAAAAASFEQAASFKPHPASLLNAAEAWDLAGAPERAAQHCDHVLALPEVDAVHRKGARGMLERLLPRVATLQVEGPSDLALSLDGGPSFEPPAVRRLSPGRHDLSVSRRGLTETRREVLFVKAGELRRLALTSVGPGTQDVPSSLLHETSPRPRADRHRVPKAAWVAFSVSGVAAVASTAFGIMTLNARGAYNANPKRSTLAEFKRDRLGTNVALGLAAVAAAFGIGVIVW